MKRLFTVFLCVVCLSVPVLAAADEELNKDTKYAQGLAGFIERLFVPRDDYFIKKMSALNDHVNEKLGGLAYLYQLIDNFFHSLDMGDSAAQLNFSLPDNFLYQGYKGFSTNIFSSAGPFVRLLKDVLNVTLCIFTAIVCYHKLRSFFQE